MPAFLLRLLPLLLSMGSSIGARKLLASGAGQAAKATAGGLFRKAVPAKLGQAVSAGAAKLPSTVRRAGGFLGSTAGDLGIEAGVGLPVFLLASQLLGQNEPTQIHGENSLVPPQGGADELTSLLASLSGGIEGGELDALDLEELLSKFSPPAQERRLI